MTGLDADLILIHGFWSKPDTWDNFADAIGHDTQLGGIRLHRFGYESPKTRLPFSHARIPNFDDIAQSIPAYIAANAPAGSPIAFVTHSQGGLILQRYLAWMLIEGRGRELERIRLVVMLACPNEGSEFLRPLRKLVRFSRHPQAAQLAVLNTAVGEARKIVLRQVVSATTVDDRNCPIPLYVYSGRTDNIVTKQSAQSVFPEAESLPGDHFSIIDPRCDGNLTEPTIAGHLLRHLSPTPPVRDLTGALGEDLDARRQSSRISYLYGLPAAVSDFVGRNNELAAIRHALVSGSPSAPYIAAISGKPGVGKSALAIQAAQCVAGHFSDGQLYVNLRGQGGEALDPMEVITGFLLALGVKRDELGRRDDLVAQYRSELYTRRCLLVIDNAADESQVRPLVPSTPRCAMIVTSRAVLAALDGATKFDLDLIGMEEGVALLSAVSGRDLTNDSDAEVVVSLCGYLPLAVRIAGGLLAQRRYWTSERLRTELSDEQSRIRKLTVGDLDIRACFGLSLQGLEAFDLMAFRSLAISPVQRFTVHSAADILDYDQSKMEIALERLFNAQLLEARTDGYFMFHDLIRLYAKQLPGDKAAQSIAIGLEIESRMASEFEEAYINSARLLYATTQVWNEGDLSVRTRFDDLYVDQVLLSISDVSRLSTSVAALYSVSRGIIFGDPGAGKSMLAQRLVSDLLTPATLSEIGQRVPFLIRMRDWREGENALAFVVREVRRTFQIELTPAVLELLIHSGRVVLVFDGLDEISQSLRSSVSRELGFLSDSYPLLRLLITSRPIGFVPIPTAGAFEMYQIAPWSKAEAVHFAANYFRILGLDSQEDESLERLSHGFARELERLDTLGSNPLLIAQLAWIYRSQGYLPQRLADLYSHVIVQVFERWDRARGIDPGPYVGVYGQRVFEILAGESLFSERWQRGLPSSWVWRTARNWIESTVGVSADEAAAFASDFVDFYRGRAALLVEIDISDHEEPIFAFATPVLRDYLAATYLVRVSSIEDLGKRIVQLVEWQPSSQVPELVLQVAEWRLERGAERVAVLALDAARGQRGEALVKELLRSVAFDLRIPPALIESLDNP
ncbi:alpha/beta fold hydrolase [Gordonia sp. NPDC003424]